MKMLRQARKRGRGGERGGHIRCWTTGGKRDTEALRHFAVTEHISCVGTSKPFRLSTPLRQSGPATISVRNEKREERENACCFSFRNLFWYVHKEGTDNGECPFQRRTPVHYPQLSIRSESVLLQPQARYDPRVEREIPEWARCS